MTRLKTRSEDLLGTTRVLRRIQNGIEILERETIRTIKVNDGRFMTRALRTNPRLVIDNAISTSKRLITKSRSQLGDIDTFLRSIIEAKRM